MVMGTREEKLARRLVQAHQDFEKLGEGYLTEGALKVILQIFNDVSLILIEHDERTSKLENNST